jgi:protein-disulfide isomerase
MSTLKIPVSPEDHAEGSADAAVTLVEYGDYECPHCRAAHSVVKKLQRHFKGSLRFVYRNFPLTQIHPNAQAAAESAEFAGSKGKFWQMHDQLFHRQDDLSFELYQLLAVELELDAGELARALEEGTYSERVRADFSGGVRSGVNGTPTFFINGDRHNGPADYETLVEAIEAANPAG